jgi:SAM-dependent methyltransferase
MAGSETAGHYQRLAGRYDRNWSHSLAFLDWMARAMTEVGGLRARDRIADVGCGTGLFTRRIRELVQPLEPILCVDPSVDMLAQLPADPGLRPVRASAEQLARGQCQRAPDAPYEIHEFSRYPVPRLGRERASLLVPRQVSVTPTRSASAFKLLTVAAEFGDTGHTPRTRNEGSHATAGRNPCSCRRCRFGNGQPANLTQAVRPALTDIHL